MRTLRPLLLKPGQITKVCVFVSGTAEAKRVKESVRGNRVTFELPQHIPFADRRFQEVSKRALANPEEFWVPWLPRIVAGTVRWAIVIWLLAYLPAAFRRVYGGSRLTIGLKPVAFTFLYVFGFAVFGFGFVTTMAMLTF